MPKGKARRRNGSFFLLFCLPAVLAQAPASSGLDVAVERAAAEAPFPLGAPVEMSAGDLRASLGLPDTERLVPRSSTMEVVESNQPVSNLHVYQRFVGTLPLIDGRVRVRTDQEGRIETVELEAPPTSPDLDTATPRLARETLRRAYERASGRPLADDARLDADAWVDSHGRIVWRLTVDTGWQYRVVLLEDETQRIRSEELHELAPERLQPVPTAPAEDAEPVGDQSSPTSPGAITETGDAAAIGYRPELSRIETLWDQKKAAIRSWQAGTADEPSSLKAGTGQQAGQYLFDHERTRRAGSIAGNGIEGFEGSFPGSYWVTGDLNGASGADTWGKVSCSNPHSGSWHAWSSGTGGKSPCSTYDFNMDSYMCVETQYLGTFASGTNALTFWIRQQVENNYDYSWVSIQGFEVEPAVNTNPVPDAVFTPTIGYDTFYSFFTITLGSAFDSTMWVRVCWAFHSDDFINEGGTYVDDIDFNSNASNALFPISGGFDGLGKEGLPDLRVSAMRWKSATVDEGDPFYIECEVTNAGGSTASPTQTQLFLSTDDDFDTSDDGEVTPTQEAGSLDPGEAEWVRWDFDFPDLSSSGSYAVWPICLVDVDGEVTESDEINIFKAATNSIAITGDCDSPVLELNRIQPGSLTEQTRYDFVFRGSGFSTDTEVHLANQDTGTTQVYTCAQLGCSVNAAGTEYTFSARTPAAGNYCASMHQCQSDSPSRCGTIAASADRAGEAAFPDGRQPEDVRRMR